MRKSPLLSSVLLFLLSSVISCNPERLQHSDKLKQQMADMKIKRVTDADLSEAVNSWGEQLVTIAQQEASAKLASTTDPAGVCNLRDLPKTQALAKRYGMTISLLSAADVQNPALSKKEREVLDAYAYNAENKLAQTSNIQRIADTLFVYNAAVPATNALCQQCFGKQKQPLAVWRLAFPKREVIRHFNAKKL
ncbi:hypothetical protein J2I47_14005 [Fibrella sp. HMF5335]|uniref:DUF3365 domain-containing protein n=1 Tax=Fibrella rubiginis TaxID=2817060 RepID=A0A939GJM8_9BACT|nr:hypothetical protein [Fibrella rubiginis]MBO0937667.1 hypothetical protein [Fibrella rubiginis]